MKIRNYICASSLVLVALFSVFICLAFSTEDTIREKKVVHNNAQSLIQKELKSKLEKFEKAILARCKNEALKEAELFVDSLVAEHLNDTIPFPAKPKRPELPKKIILNDSTGIAPIIKEQ